MIYPRNKISKALDKVAKAADNLSIACNKDNAMQALTSAELFDYRLRIGFVMDELIFATTLIENEERERSEQEYDNK